MTNKQVKTKLCPNKIHVPILSVKWDNGETSDQMADDWEVLENREIFKNCLELPKVKKWRRESKFADQVIERWQFWLDRYYKQQVADQFDEEEESDKEDEESTSTYEQTRDDNIAQNNAVLAGLGLGPPRKK